MKINKKIASILIGIYLLVFVLMKMGVINTYNTGIIILILINITLAVSLNLTMGFLGQLALGHAGFMALGAYTSALLTMNMSLPPVIAFPIGLISGGLVALAFSMIIGIPTLRLSGDYLAIVTLAFNEIIRNILESMTITNGAKGLNGIPRYTTFTSAYIVMVVCILSIYLLIKSRHGRSIVSISQDEIASEACGVNTTYYKLLAFGMSAFFAGLAGSLYAHQVVYISPSDFDYNKSIEIAIMVVFGGLSNIQGSIISATILTALPQLLIEFEKWRMLIYSLILIVFMIFKQTGKLTIIKEKIKASFQKNKKGGE